MLLSRIKSVISDQQFTYAVSNFFAESVRNPYKMSRETAKFFSHWLVGKKEKPKTGLCFEQHCHSHFSDGAELADIVNLLFDKGISLWSLTDHNNCNAFDSLSAGKYVLNSESKTRKNLEVEVNPDKRSMIIHAGEKQIVLLRSVEYYTNKGEINLHGFAGKVPKQRMPFEDAVRMGVDSGAWVAINHPYFWHGLGYHGRRNIERAVNAGAVAIEKNGTEIPPQIFCPVRAERDAEQFNLALLASGDSHKLHMYGMSGLVFDKTVYSSALQQMQGNPADAIKHLVANKLFRTYLNYLTPKQFLDFFTF